MAPLIITTTSLSLARELWRRGEPELADKAFRLSPAQVVDVGVLAGALYLSGHDDRLWPDGPRSSSRALMLAAVKYLEGRARPCARSRRLPERSLPPHLQASEEERWTALADVSAALDKRHVWDGIRPRIRSLALRARRYHIRVHGQGRPRGN